MLNVSRSLPDIAVIRGGSAEFELSLEEGKEVLKSLSKLGYKPLDVVVDRAGEWTAQGLPTDAHAVYSRAHTIVDTTRDRHAPHIALAKKMGVSLLFSRGNDVHMDREDMYRLLRMQGFKVPDTIVVRASQPLKDSIFREVWSTYHTPLMVRPLVRRSDASARLITMYPDLEKTVREYHKRGIDIHILTYRKSPTASMPVLPNFRGERLYTPMWVETFDSISSIPGPASTMRVHLNAPDYRKKEMRDIATKVYETLELRGPACIDVVPYKDGYIVVNIETNPSIRKGGRFMKSLESTGVDIGQYVHEQVKASLEDEPLRSVFQSDLHDYAR